MDKKATTKTKKKHQTKRRRTQWQKILGGALTGLLVCALLVFLCTRDGARDAQDAVQQTSAPAAMAPGETEVPEATEMPRTPSPAPTHTPEPTPAATATPEPVELLITCVGDCTLGGDIPSGGYKSFESVARREGPEYFLKNVKPLFEADDLTLVNLEGPLTNSDEKRKGRLFNFRGYPQYAMILSSASVEVANVANNHALDYGKAGLEETKQVLEAQGIGVSGFEYIWLEEIKGVRVCSIGFTEWDFKQREITWAIGYMRPKCDLLIVSMHWGAELRHDATGTMERLGKACVDAGADLVVGNHSHVYGGLASYKGKYILYSLGNFCFGGNKHPADKRCTIFQQKFVFQNGAVSDGGINLIPCSISSSSSGNNYQPTLLTGSAVNKYMQDVASVSDLNGQQITWIGGDPGPDMP